MEQPRLTTEQRERLRPYERQLHQAYYADYCTGMSTVKVSDLFAIYEEVYHAKGGCPVCPVDVVNVVKRLGRLYYAAVGDNATAHVRDEAPQKTKKTKTTNPKK